MTDVEKLEHAVQRVRDAVSIAFRGPTTSKPETNASREQKRDDSSGALRRDREMLERHRLL